MKTITFKKDGGPIVAKVSSTFAQPGFYTLQLWEAASNQIVLRQQGNFLNPEDDAYNLPVPNELNDRRIIQSIVTVNILPPINEYKVSLTLLQDGEILDVVSLSNQTQDPTVNLNLFAILKQAEEDQTA